MSHKILIIEDEPELARGLEINLRLEGYAVTIAGAGDTGLKMAFQERPDLVLLDVMLPGMNGLDVCRALRQKGFESPIVMLTAKGEEIDRVLGLELGADDYVAKPFGLRELLARIRVQLRRQPKRAGECQARCRFGAVEIDFDQCHATRGSEPLELTGKEYQILKLLIQCRGQVVTRDRLLSEVWGYQACPNTRTVDNHILRLRQKLEDDPSNPAYILSIYGEGYKFVG